MSLIELFDAQRLKPARRWPAANPALLPLVAVLGVMVAGYTSHTERQQLRQERQAVDAQLAQLKSLSNANLGDAALANRQALMQRAEGLESQLAALEPSPGGEVAPLPPSGWLARLEVLAGPAISLTRVDIERSGAARVEGMALDAQAISRFVSAWGSNEAMAALPTRTLDVQQAQAAPPSENTGADAAATPPRLLKFVVSAAAWPDGASARAAGTPASGSAQATAAGKLPGAPGPGSGNGHVQAHLQVQP